MSSPNGMEVMCSIRAGLGGSSLRQSPMSGSALNGNMKQGGLFEVRVAEVGIQLPYYQATRQYLNSLSYYSASWWIESYRFFYNCHTTYNSSDFGGFNYESSCSMDDTWPGTSPPIDTMYPTGNDYSYTTPTWPAYTWNTNLPTQSFGLYTSINPPPSPSGYTTSSWDATTLHLSNVYSLNDTIITLSNEYHYSTVMNYAISRMNSISSGSFTALWTGSYNESIAYPNRGTAAGVASSSFETYPVNSFAPCNGNEKITHTTVAGQFTIISPYKISSVGYSVSNLAYDSSVGHYQIGAGTVYIKRGQLKYESYVSQSYYIVETLSIAPAAMTISGSIPYVVVSSGSMAHNQILDVPISTVYTNAPYSTHYTGCGEYPAMAIDTYFCIGLETNLFKIPGLPSNTTFKQIVSW